MQTSFKKAKHTMNVFVFLNSGDFLFMTNATNNVFISSRFVYSLLTMWHFKVFVYFCVHSVWLNISVLCVGKHPSPVMNRGIFHILNREQLPYATSKQDVQSASQISETRGFSNAFYNLHMFSKCFVHCVWSHSPIFSHSILDNNRCLFTVISW